MTIQRRLHIGLWVCGLTLFAAGFSAAEPVHCYLVDSRIHLAVVDSGSDAAGHICWLDTVTGERGEAPFTQVGARLRFEGEHGSASVARLVADVAIVVEDPPWRHPRSRLSLGVALN